MQQSRFRAGVWIGGLAVVLLGVVCWAATVGVLDVSVLAVGLIVLDELGIVGFTPSGQYHSYVVLQLRLPRIVLSAAVGFALAAAGTVMQGFFQNPMADPSIIGVSSGAAAGAVVLLTLPVTIPYGVPLAAFLGAMITAFAVYLIATTDGRTPVATLLLAGVAVQTLLGATISLLLVRAESQELKSAILWLMGSLANTQWDEALLVAGVSVGLVSVLVAFARDLNVLLLGEADAHALGVDVRWTRRLLLALSSLITGAAVAFVGVVGFVGLVVPHILRLLVGPDHRILLPASALGGATFLVLADTLARSALGGVEIPVGIVTAFVGAPFFLYLLQRREVHAL